VYYAYNICIPLLFPYYHKIHQLNPGKKVWLIQDNAPPHKKAFRLLKHQIEREGIIIVDWPVNSPERHPIEQYFSYMEDQLDDYEANSASKQVKQWAREELERQWKGDIGWCGTEGKGLHCYERK